MKICYIPAKIKEKERLKTIGLMALAMSGALKDIVSFMPTIAWGIVFLGLLIEVLKYLQGKTNDNEFAKGMVRIGCAGMLAIVFLYIPDFIDYLFLYLS